MVDFINETLDAKDLKSIYHGSFFKITRLHQYWSEASRARRAEDYNEWKKVLDDIKSELNARMSEPERQKRERIVLRMVLPALTLAYVNKRASGNARVSANAEAYTALNKYENFLRRVEARLGLDMKMPEKFDLTEGI